MDAVVEHTLYDWFRDIWLPAAGAILIPVAIAFFTWWFGASRAEKQKEMQELRDNLNLLISLLMSYMELLANARHKFESLQKSVNSIKNYNNARNNPAFFTRFTCENILKDINVSSYSACLVYDEDFLVCLIRIKDLGAQLENIIEERNASLISMASCENIKIREERYASFLVDQSSNLDTMLNLVDVCLIQSYNYLKRIKSFEKQYIDLKLNNPEFDDETFFSKIEKEYTQRNKQND